MKAIHALLGLSLGCAGAADEPADTDATAVDSDGTSRDSDPPVDSDTDVRPVDTDDPDTDDPDTDVRDTDPPHTDAPDTDVGDTDDTDPPVLAWSGGFVSLTATVEAGFPSVDVGSRGAAREPQGTSLLVGDIDEDGVADAIATRLEPRFQAPPAVQVWRLDAGGATDQPVLAAALLPPGADVGPIGLLDLDGDGHLDLVSGDLDDLLWWGDGQGRFAREATRTSAAAATGCSTTSGLSLWDVDLDGWTDLLVTPHLCAGRPEILRRTGPRGFAGDPQLSVGDGGPVSLYAMASWSVAGEQLHLLVGQDDGAPLHPGWLTGPARASSLSPATRTPASVYWATRPQTFGANILGIEAMGAAVSDLDQDGDLDVVVTPGGPPMVVFEGTPTGYVDASLRAALEAHAIPGTATQLPWSVESVDLDLDGQLDLLVTYGDDATSWGLADGLVHVNHAWRQTAPWVYQEVGDPLGWRQPGGWRGLALVDHDADGDADAALGGRGHAPRFLENRIAAGDAGAPRHSVSLRLIGTTSNHEALGTEVEADVSGLPLQRRTVLIPGNPLSLHAPTVFLSLGEATQTGDVRIRWPSGWTQVVTGLAGDRAHVITEPPVISLLDADRHASADGFSTSWLQVRPRSPDGTVDTAATVSLQLDGVGSVATAGRWRGGVWEAEVRAPSAPGETRIVVAINGVAVPIQPVLWWD